MTFFIANIIVDGRNSTVEILSFEYHGRLRLRVEALPSAPAETAAALELAASLGWKKTMDGEWKIVEEDTIEIPLTPSGLPQYLDLTKVYELIDAPILDLGNYTGLTGYLDAIIPSDMSAPVMKGVDAAGRPFIALYTTVQIDGEKERDEVVLCAHLRYEPRTEGYNPWVQAGSMGHTLMEHDDPAGAVEALGSLLAGRPVYDYDDCTYRLVESV